MRKRAARPRARTPSPHNPARPPSRAHRSPGQPWAPDCRPSPLRLARDISSAQCCEMRTRAWHARWPAAGLRHAWLADHAQPSAIYPTTCLLTNVQRHRSQRTGCTDEGAAEHMDACAGRCDVRRHTKACTARLAAPCRRIARSCAADAPARTLASARQRRKHADVGARGRRQPRQRGSAGRHAQQPAQRGLRGANDAGLVVRQRVRQRRQHARQQLRLPTVSGLYGRAREGWCSSSSV